MDSNAAAPIEAQTPSAASPATDSVTLISELAHDDSTPGELEANRADDRSDGDDDADSDREAVLLADADTQNDEIAQADLARLIHLENIDRQQIKQQQRVQQQRQHQQEQQQQQRRLPVANALQQRMLDEQGKANLTLRPPTKEEPTPNPNDDDGSESRGKKEHSAHSRRRVSPPHAQQHPKHLSHDDGRRQPLDLSPQTATGESKDRRSAVALPPPDSERVELMFELDHANAGGVGRNRRTGASDDEAGGRQHGSVERRAKDEKGPQSEVVAVLSPLTQSLSDNINESYFAAAPKTNAPLSQHSPSPGRPQSTLTTLPSPMVEGSRREDTVPALSLAAPSSHPVQNAQPRPAADIQQPEHVLHSKPHAPWQISLAAPRDDFGVRRFTRIALPHHSAEESLVFVSALLRNHQFTFRVDPAMGKVFISWPTPQAVPKAATGGAGAGAGASSNAVFSSAHPHHGRVGSSPLMPSSSSSASSAVAPTMLCCISIHAAESSNGGGSDGVADANSSAAASIVSPQLAASAGGAILDFRKIRGDTVAFHEFFMRFSHLCNRAQ
jgi:hypothetical protein